LTCTASLNPNKCESCKPSERLESASCVERIPLRVLNV